MRLNVYYLKIIRFFHLRYHLKIIAHVLKSSQKKKYVCNNCMLYHYGNKKKNEK